MNTRRLPRSANAAIPTVCPSTAIVNSSSRWITVVGAPVLSVVIVNPFCACPGGAVAGPHVTAAADVNAGSCCRSARSHHALGMHFGDGVRVVAQFGQHIIGVFAEQR